MNLATLREGPANVRHLGQLFHFRGGLTVTPLAELFDIDSDLYGSLDKRALENSIVVSGTPVGVWTAEQIAALYRTAQLMPGQLITPSFDVDSINTSSNVVTLVGATGPRTGCPIRWGTTGTKPAIITLATTYYWRAATANTGTLHASAADAESNSNAIDFADDGDGDQMIIEQEPLIIEAISANRRITFHNAAVTAPPPAILSATATILGQVAFGCFRKEGAAWDDDNSLYTVEKVALSDTPPDKDDIPTQEYSCEFGAAPWDDFKTRGPITLTPTLGTDPVATDGLGIIGMKVASRAISATLQPAGFSEAQMLDLLGLQGGTVARGKSRGRADLVITGTGVHCTLYNGAPRQLPQTFAATGPRAGELEIVGAADPTTGDLFRFATTAPA